MGSYDITCAASSLPIKYGDKVRFILLNPGYESSYEIRTLPIKGVYNDYGSIEKVDLKSPLTKLMLEGLSCDIAEIGVGDNSIHDVAVFSDMDLEKWLTALQEERVKARVNAQVGVEYKPEPLPKAKLLKLRTPTLRGVMAHLEKGFKKKPLLVDEEAPGMIRVRQNDFGDSTKELERAQKMLNEHFATVITSGSGSYASCSELLVFAKPETYKQRTQTEEFVSRHKPDTSDRRDTTVRYVMILEEVWQQILSDFKTCVRVEFEPEYKRTDGDFSDILKATKRVFGICKKELNKEIPLHLRYFTREAIRAKIYDDMHDYASHLVSAALGERSIGNGLGAHWNFAIENMLNEESEKVFIESLAETACVLHTLRTNRIFLRPEGGYGPQFGEYEDHLRFLNGLVQAAERLKKKHES